RSGGPSRCALPKKRDSESQDSVNCQSLDVQTVRGLLLMASGRCRLRAFGERSPQRSARLQHILDPVPHGVDADSDVVDLTMMEAAFLAPEYLQCLMLRADCGKAFLRQSQRYLLVAF